MTLDLGVGTSTVLKTVESPTGAADPRMAELRCRATVARSLRSPAAHPCLAVRQKAHRGANHAATHTSAGEVVSRDFRFDC